MTADEKKIIEKINANFMELTANYRETVTSMKKVMETLNEKIDQKHAPIHLENDILSSVQSSMDKVIREALSGYSSPLIKLVQEVVNNHTGELRTTITSSFEEVIRTEDFKRSIVSAFSHKVARSIISNNDGLYDKVANELKQDATFKAKMALAVANVVEECLSKEKVMPSGAEGHDKPCHYCGEPCNSFAANPSLWPIPLCHADEPGVVKWHHIGCVSERLKED